MPQCEYTGPSGNTCGNDAQESGTRCVWHDHEASKRDIDVKSHLEECARNFQSCEGYELNGADLGDADIMELDLSYANLERAQMRNGHAYGINLTGARLQKADLEDATLREAILADAELLGTNLEGASLDRVDFGKGSVLRNHKLAEALSRDGDGMGAKTKFQEAEEIYRNIRQRYEGAGKTDVAGRFFYLEMVSKRRQMPYFSVGRFWSKLVDLICGYGEEPVRVIGVSLMVILGCALLFCISGIGHADNEYAFHLTNSLWENVEILAISIYYSIVTFTTLGYGDMVAFSWGKGIAALEAFVGVFLNSMFLLTFAKKMVR
jgi:hypothetical protein